MSDKQAAQKVSISAGSLLLIALIVWLFSPNDGKTHRHLQALEDEVKVLRASVDRLAKALEAQRRIEAPEQGRAAPATAPAPAPAPSAAPDKTGSRASPAARSTAVEGGIDPAALQVERNDEADRSR